MKEQNPEKNKTEELISITKQEYAKLREQAARAIESEDKILRLQADFENSRKRFDRDRQEFIKFANEELIFELLNVLDDLERSVSLAESKHEDLPAFLKGVEIILAHLYDLLKKRGLKPIEAKGKIFDPLMHEALMQVEDAQFQENTVIEEMQRGYIFNGRVIRTAKVKVSKKPTVSDS